MVSTTLSNLPSSIATATPEATCITMTPDKNGWVPYEACNAHYAYYPSFAAALFFTVVFALSLIAHITQASTYKKWKLCWPLVMGVAWEFVGFLFRALSTKNQQQDAYQMVSQILVLLAPMWINAFVYMVMGRMIYVYIPDQQIYGIKAIKLAKMFVWLDVLAFIIQAGGGTMINPEHGNQIMNIGIKIYMAGISIQQVFILTFLSIAIKFHILTHRPHLPNAITSSITTKQCHKPLLYSLYIILASITTRIMYRLAEFAAGVEGPIHRHEAYFMVMDAASMVVACVVPNLVHPGRVLRGEECEFPKGLGWRAKRALKREEKDRKKEEKRAVKEEKKARKEEQKMRKDGVVVSDMEVGSV